MSYPSKSDLKTELSAHCASSDLCEAVASEYGGQPISCNHRTPQRRVFQFGKELNVNSEEVAKCAEKLCSYVDRIKCENK